MTEVADEMGFRHSGLGNGSRPPLPCWWPWVPLTSAIPPTNPPTEHPPFIRVDLTGSESRSEIADSPVDAVMPVLRRSPGG